MPSDAPRTPNPDKELAHDLQRARFRMAEIDAEQLRNAVSSKLFGAAAEPVKIGRFTVLRRLGSGGMGVVYSAYDEQLDRKVAIKLLHSTDQAESRKIRLLREAQALARLSHPNVVHVYEVGTFRGQVFVAMEFVLGTTLHNYLDAERRPRRDILERFTQAGQGLAAAHAAGLIHRDFKPDNVLVSDDGRTLVVDFGLARATNVEATESADTAAASDSASSTEAPESRAAPPSPTSQDSLSSHLTRTGAILGTPAYMAPEQHRGSAADARSDQFSFCIALWEALAGERPFHGKNALELAINVNAGQPRSSSKARPMPGRLKRTLSRGLAVTPDDRFPTMEALLAALPQDHDRKRIAWSITAAASLVAVAAFTWATTHTPVDACDSGLEKLTGIWDGMVRSRLKARFLDTGAPFAGDAWRSASERLDAYALDWQTMHREACENAMESSEESPELYGRRMVCLGQRLTALEQLTSLLGEAGVDDVRRAVDAASNLPTLDRCADEASLMALDAPLDDEMRRELQRVDAILARGQSASALGRYAKGKQLAEQAVAQAKKLGHTGRLGKGLLLLGQLQARLKQLDAAEASLHDALRQADAAGDDDTRVRAWIRLLRLVGYERRDFEAGERIAADARAAIARLGRAPLLEAELHTHLGSIAKAKGDYDEAIKNHEAALEIQTRELGEDHTRVASTLNNLGNAMYRAGRESEAEDMQRRALASFERTLGPEHPHVAIVLSNIGNRLLQHPDEVFFGENPRRVIRGCNEAEKLLRRAIAIRESQPGAERAVGFAVHNLGEALRCAGSYTAGLEQFRRALAIKETVYLEGSDKKATHPSVHASLNGIARCHLGLAQPQDALLILERALGILELPEAQKFDPVQRGETYFATAITLRELDQAQLGEKGPADYVAAARAAYVEAGESHAGQVRALDAWPARKPAPVPTAE